VSQPRWLGRLVVEIVQHDLILTHGGLPGLRDETVLQTALARPRQVFAYDQAGDIAALAAAYAYGICRAHPFNDGNKRVAFVVAAVFAELNGFQLDAPQTEVVERMLLLAAGELAEQDLAEWIRAHLVAL
jgi:death on curing protein